MDSNKMKYDIIRNTLRTMLANGRFNSNPTVKTEIEVLLETVREQSDETLKGLRLASIRTREVVKGLASAA